MRLKVEVVLEDGDAAELDQLTNHLRRELLLLDIQAVDRLYVGEPPEGARAFQIAALGALLVKLAPETLKAVIGAAQNWLRGSSGRTVHLEVAGDKLDLTGVTSAQQQQLIDDWIRRHSQG